MEMNDNGEIFKTQKFQGRPSSDAGRPEAEIAVYDFLDKAGVERHTDTPTGLHYGGVRGGAV